MSVDNFKLLLTPVGNGSKIEMNGKEVQNVRSITVRTAVDETTKVTIEYAVCKADIEAEGELVRVPPPFPPSRFWCDACGGWIPEGKHRNWVCRLFGWLDRKRDVPRETSGHR